MRKSFCSLLVTVTPAATFVALFSITAVAGAVPMPAGPFGPAPPISGLRAHFAADGDVYQTGTTQATDGQTVETWVDSAGAPDDATQSVGAEQPTWVELGVDTGGELFRPVVRFSGSFLEMNSVADVMSGADQDLTVMAVIKFGGDQRASLVGFGSAASTTPLYQIGPRRINEGDDFRMQRRDDASTIGAVHGGDADRPNSDFIVLTALDTGTAVSLYVNGVPAFENQTLNVGTLTLDQTSIGSLPLGTNDFDQLFGDMAEIMVFDRALSASEQGVAGYYLGQKYGISTSYVPEPSAAMLFAIGCAVLSASRRGRRGRFLRSLSDRAD